MLFAQRVLQVKFINWQTAQNNLFQGISINLAHLHNEFCSLYKVKFGNWQTAQNNLFQGISINLNHLHNEFCSLYKVKFVNWQTAQNNLLQGISINLAHLLRLGQTIFIKLKALRWLLGYYKSKEYNVKYHGKRCYELSIITVQRILISSKPDYPQ